MDTTDCQNLIHDLRRQRLQDPEVINNGYCAACEYTGEMTLADGTRMMCECRRARLMSAILDKRGVPRRFRGMAWDAVVKAEGQDWFPGRVAATNHIKRAYIEALDQINIGRTRWEVNTGRTARSVALVGGSRRVKSAWACQVFEEMIGQGGLMYYPFGDLKAMLSDFHRLDEQQEWAEIMGTFNLIVIDGVHGGPCGPGFPSAWDAGVAARQNSGLATILLVEENHTIDSYAWRDWLDDPDMLVLPFSLEGQATTQMAANSTALSAQRSTSPPPQARQVVTQDDAEAAILGYLMAHPDKIVKLIYDNIPAPREIVKAALESLEATGDVLKRLKPGKSGTMTVYYVRPEADDQPSRVKPPTANKQPVADKPLTYTELEEITQVPRTTLFRWRKTGLSDDEIVSRAEAERVP